jgi:hypothetical protein
MGAAEEVMRSHLGEILATMTLAEVLTAIIAVYGAVLATLTFIVQQRDRRPRISVSVSYGTPVYGSQLGDQMVLLTATNPGHRPVTLVGAGFFLPDGRQLIMPSPLAVPALPCELNEGKSCQVFMSIPGIVERVGPRISLVGFFRDALGTTHRSSRWLFAAP